MKKLFSALLVLCICTCVSVLASDQAPPGEKQTYLPELSVNALACSNVTIDCTISTVLENKQVSLGVFDYQCHSVGINLSLPSMSPAVNDQFRIRNLYGYANSKTIQPVARSGALNMQHSYWLTSHYLKVKPLLL